MLVAELWEPTDPPLLIDSILSSSPTETISQVVITEHSRFLTDEKRVPIWFGLEYATQTITLHYRLLAKNLGVPAIEGHFGKASSIEQLANHFPIGQKLKIIVSKVSEKDGNTLFRCEVRGADVPMVKALITYYQHELL